ncbi:MAG: hypothetical protein GX239_01795, partial [Clostridiaceae bacterium]|nr:hypothetical protein [Clostridiaceae bacterium]
NNLIQLINVEDETIVIEGVLDDSDPLRIFFNEIPLGTYKPVLKQEALDAGYIQTSENTITVNEAPSPVFASSTGIFFEKEYEEPTGYASTAPYANQEYIDSVGQEVAAADAKYLVDNNLIQLINVEDETIVIEGVLDDSDPLRIFFNEIPLGTYKPVLKQEALDAGYIQTSENTITVNKAPSPVFASSTGVFFEKKVAAVTVELTQTEQTHNLTWNVLDDIDGYAIYRRAPGEDKMTLFTETTDTSYTYDVENTGYYFYKVYPFTLTEDGVKVLGKSANYVFARAVQPIAPVTNLKAVNKYNRFNDLTWDPVEGADGYAIYRMAPGEDKLSYHISNVRNGYTEEVTETGYYFYRVLAYRKNIDGTLTLSESIEYVYAYNDSSAAVNLGN